MEACCTRKVHRRVLKPISAFQKDFNSFYIAWAKRGKRIPVRCIGYILYLVIRSYPQATQLLLRNLLFEPDLALPPLGDLYSIVSNMDFGS